MPRFDGFAPLSEDDERRRQAMRDQVTAPAPVAANPPPPAAYNPVLPKLESGLIKDFKMSTAGQSLQPKPVPAAAPPTLPDPTRDPLRPSIFSSISGPTASVPTTPALSRDPLMGETPPPVAPAVPEPAARLAPTAPAPAVSLPAPIRPAAPAPPSPSVQPPTASPADDPSLTEAKGFLSTAEATDGSEEEAKEQELRNQRATVKYQRAQGVQMQVAPTGQTTPALDDAGNPKFKPTTLSPITRLEDGRAYRASRDATGNERYFDIEAQGKEGADYHVDPHTGEKYVDSNHPDGTSRREVIGQDPFIPAINELHDQLGVHQGKRREIDLTISRAEDGVADAPGFGRLSLPALRQQHTALVGALVPAQKTFNETQKFLASGGTLNAQQLDDFRSAATTLNQHGPAVQPLLDEIGSREGAITAARQQRTSVNADAVQTAQAKRWIQDKKGTPQLGDDLAAVAHGQPVAENRTNWYTRAGLLAPEPQPDGSNRLVVTPRGAATLDRNTRAQMAADPGSYHVAADAFPAPAQPAAQAPDVQAAPDGNAPQPTAAEPSDGSVAETPSGQTAPAKPYSVGQDGAVQFDSERPTKAVMQAWRDGVLDHDSAKQAFDVAKKADDQRAELEQLAGGAPQLKAFLAGLPAGISFMGGGAAAAAAGNASGINPAISALTGPFAPVTDAVLSGAEFLAGGALAARGAHKLQDKLGQYSETLASLNAAAKLHPGYETAGEIIPALPSAVGSVRNLARMGGIAAADLGEGASAAQKIAAGVKAVAPTVAKGAASGALAEGVLRPVVDASLDLGSEALGVDHDPAQKPTLGSVAQMAGLGALLAGHSGLEFGDHSANELGNILSRGTAHAVTRTPVGERIPPDILAEKYGNHPDVDSQRLADLGRELSPTEQELFTKAHARLSDLITQGKIDPSQGITATAQQVTRSGKPIGVSSVEFRQREGSAARSASEETPSTDQFQLSGGQTPEPPGSAPTQSPASVPPQSDPSGSPIPFSPTTVLGRTSAQPAPGAPVGQASTPDSSDNSPEGQAPTAIASAPAQSPERGEQPGNAPTANQHEAMAARVNAGEEHPIDGSDSSATHQVLTRLKARGAEVTPELAETVGTKVSNILADPDIDPQAALHALVREQSTAAAASSEPAASHSAASAADLQAENDATRLENMTRARDRAQQKALDVQKLIDAGKIAPEALEHTRSILGHLNAEIAKLQPEQPPAKTVESLTGAKLDRSRTAFHPDSGTLGIPRDQMPQVAAEHRGAMANFLAARGMEVSAQDELPGSLKPSQADFNPAKVTKAGAIREAGAATDRRILTSADGHVIDGHHQWMDRVANAPDKPMPTLRINAPARDILKQVHEFPSAGMAKAPDIVERTITAAQPGDTANATKARAWLADERAAGRSPTWGDVVRKNRVHSDKAKSILADQDRAEAAADAPAAEGFPILNRKTPAPSERQPVTTEGKAAKQTLSRLAALREKGVALDGGHRTAQREAELTLARDLNGQVLKDPKPTTPAGKAAMASIEAWEPHREGFNNGQLLALHGEHMRLEHDFTQQRLAQEAAEAAPLAVGDRASIGGLPVKVVDLPAGDKAVVETAGGKQLRFKRSDVLAKRALGKAADASKPAKTALPVQGPIKPETAVYAAQRQIKANRPMLDALGVEKVTIGPTHAASGVEFDNGTLKISAAKLARSMEVVRDNQAKLGIDGSPEEWFSQVLVHEGIHAADAAVAKSKGQTIQDRYDELPDAAMPEGWQATGRDVYGSEWDALPTWKQKAEFVRQVVEGKWSGRLSEQLYKFIRDAIAYLKKVAGFENAHPAFKAHVQEVEARIEAMRTSDSPTPLKPRAPRAFSMPHAPAGTPDALDHIVEQGGLVSPSRAKQRTGYTKYAGEYDGAPTLGGFYHHAVYGGKLMPDQMAEILHDDYGVGDGSVDGMWKAISQAKDLRATVRKQEQVHAVAEKQTARFDRDAVDVNTSKGQTEINTANLSVGDKITVGDQTLKVTGLDPDTLDVTLEDHSRYGVQRVADGETLYVEKVEPGNGKLGAARPARLDTQTRDLFAEDAPFSLRGEAVSDAERVANARDNAARGGEPSALPTLRRGENQGDLLSRQTEDLQLVGERGIDHGARQAEQERATRESELAQAKQDREQTDLFNPPVEPTGLRSMGQNPTADTSKAEPAAAPERLDEPKAEEKPVTEIADFGEKIGGARKDTAKSLGPRAIVAPSADASQPAWRRKYEVAQELRRDYVTRADKPTGKWQVIRTDGTHTRSPRFDSEAAAEAAIPLVEVGRNHGVSATRTASGAPDWHIFRKVGEHKRPVVRGGFQTEEAAKAHMAAHPEEIIEHKFDFPERPWLDHLERKGGTPRTGNVNPAMFQDAFGFRGGEFGNWNKGGDGQAALNHSYDALHDLSEILGLSPKALSLNGELAIAFGARGTGGEGAGAAHYEPGYQVINLTKIKGAGSLAHEWFHALDHYLGRQDGKATDRTLAANAREASGRDPAYVRGEYVSHGFSRESGTREELRNAFKAVNDAVAAKQTEITVPAEKIADVHAHQAKYVSDTLADLRRGFETYHQYGRGKKPPTPEQLAEFDKLTAEITSGDVGPKVYVAPQGGRRLSVGRSSFQPIEDLNTLYKSVVGRSFATNDQGSTGKRLYWQVDAMKDAQKRVDNAGGTEEKQMRNVSTNFLREARKIDERRSSDYWSTPHEMGARSFETFIADKLAHSERANDYLVHGADNRLYAMLGLKPYPEGEERGALNRAWQNVFDIIEEKATDKGQALFAAKPEPVSLEDASPGKGASAEPKEPENRQTLVAERAKLEADKRRLAASYRATGDIVPDNLLAEREAALMAREDALGSSGSSSLSAAAPEEAKPKGERTPDPSRLPSIKDVVANAVENARERTGRLPRKFTQYSTVTPEQAEQIKADTGLDLSGYRRNIDNYAVRHILKEHGDPQVETSRGNAPLSESDIERLPEVLAHPDASLLAGQNKRGQNVILSAKRAGDYFIVAEEVRDKPQVLSLATMYKKSAPPLATEAGEPASVQFKSTAHRILQQAAEQYKFLHGDDPRGRLGESDSLGAAAPERVVVPRQPDDTDNIAKARNSLADERAAGRTPTLNEITFKNRVRPDAARRIVADHDKAEQEARELDTLAAAAPAYAGIVDGIKAKVGAIKETVVSTGKKSAEDDRISAGIDSAETRAGVKADQVGNSLRLDFRNVADREAMPFVIGADDKATLKTDLALVTGSSDPKLAKRFAPVVQHAIDNFDRLKPLSANFDRLMAEQHQAERQAGVEDLVANPSDIVGAASKAPVDELSSRIVPGRAFTGLAKSIHDGRAPKSTDLATVAENRVRAGQRLINEKAFQKELFALKAGDGKPILSSEGEASPKLEADGSVSNEQKVPKGYVAVQAGDRVINVHKEYANLFKALYEPTSAVREFAVGRAALKAAAIAKHYTLMLDTFHGGRIIFKQAVGAQEFGFDKGLSLLEYSDADLGRAVAQKLYTAEEAAFARKMRPQAEELLGAGLNVGKMGDNLAEAVHAKIPGLQSVNDWIFKKLSRGAMMQVGLTFLERNAKRFPELSRADVVRRSAKEANEFLGNLGHQGWIKSKTMQDVARLAMLAPNWTESQFRSEMRGYAQAGRAAADAVTGKGVRLGNVAQGMAMGVLGLVVANQIINLLTRGKPTWDNPEEGRKFSAWLPGGPQNRGFWFSPLELAAEFTHTAVKYLEHGESAVDALSHIASNKLSPLARGAKDLVTGRDYAGRPYGSMRERLTAAAVDALPSPMFLGAFLEKDPKSSLGYRYNRQPGSGEKQLLGSAGLKVEAEPSARSKMYGIAERFRPQQSNVQRPASAYADLRKLLDAQDRIGAKNEILRLVNDDGRTVGAIGKAIGLRDGGKVATELFTGSAATEEKMIYKLTSQERKIWVQAQHDRQASAKLFAEVAAGVRGQLNHDDSGKAQALAAVAKKQGNPGLAHTLTRTGAITAPGKPAPDPLGTGQPRASTTASTPSAANRDPLRPLSAEELRRRVMSGK